MLLNFAAQNPGMTRVLIGDALVNEDERLQLRMNQFYDRVELALKQALRIAASEGQAHEADVPARASMLVSFVIGRWHRYAKSGFKNNPSQDAALQITLLLIVNMDVEVFALLDDASPHNAPAAAGAPHRSRLYTGHLATLRCET
jgi:hypothetical protein